MSDRQPPKGDRTSYSAVESRGTTVSIKLVVAVLILVGVTFFVFQNTQTVPLRWLFFEFSMPLWGLTLILFGAGMLMGWALYVRRLRRRAR